MSHHKRVILRESLVQTNLLERDYSEIDRDLLGKETIENADLKFPDDEIAPAQGYIFAYLIQPLRKLLERCDVLYRE
jgi:hypothetical protein